MCAFGAEVNRMDRVIEIVNFVMKQVLFQGDNPCSERELVDSLVHLGYTPEEIEVAFKLLYSIPSSLKTDVQMVDDLFEIKDGYRVLSQAEQRKLSLTSQGEIIRLINSSLVTSKEVEQILAEVLQSEVQEVGLRELELILHKVINDDERLLMILPHPLELGPNFFLN